ncbi:hypothetical protein ACFGVS_22115 [Mucilaginibacter sp. AW1-7]|uniref:hypothetical protein n=1 Tax=Mucilaginibacter sp. AW1-7 TaxID=3349874 RepID=UPI003F73E64C
MKLPTCVILLSCLLTFACTQPHQPPSYDFFKNKYGMLYFSYPETGREITAVFLPYENEADTAHKEIGKLLKLKYLPGIKFLIFNSKVITELTTYKSFEGDLEKESNLKVHIIPSVKINYHLIKPMITEKSAIDKDLHSDVLVCNGNSLYHYYYYSIVEIDSIKNK